ncbi:rho GTPase-activating protein 6-like isoform X2 [Mercenaria mercenaria]|uniref:rho GTPase-activating protein 6-like isoform X2 n=1 Tax=Mercenaria mercenaria TaxID=6596 RepID=UPI00234F4361|nr:rho GTPase-activating protein 6-like isoform X2 [Mercenaria mercenaria]
MGHMKAIDAEKAMQKSKSPSAHHRILPKRWRSKPRNSTAGQCLWSPEGNCTWCNVSGRRVVLRPVSILQLSEAERLALQKIVLQKLQSEDLGCSVVIPKEHRESGRRKKHLLSIKRSKSANISGFIHGLADREKDHQAPGLVFGIPLQKCIANDAEQRKRNSGALKERKGSDVILTRQGPRKSSSSSQGSLENITHNGTSFSESQKRNASSDSLSESESTRNNSSLIDALVLSNNRNDNLGQSYLPLYATGPPQVPHIVRVCFKHIETYGLRVLGIFRVGSSKKRTKQLRDEFDTGRDVKLNESHNPHEVGAVLKEYFRDLPEPLLTRDLYSPLLAARGLYEIEKQIEVTRMLISLLPVANRDTLWALLQFLYKVAEHSTDVLDENGQTLPGNKMDSHNLATLFGPNILHKAKATEKEFTVESMERAEERKEVIEVVQAMVDKHQLLFQIPASLHDEILKLLLETDPETTEQILKRISSDNGIDPDPDTSSSLYDDSDASLPHSPVSENNLNIKDSSGLQSTPTLRVARSAEILTPVARRKFFYSSPEEESVNHRRKSDVNNPMERPKFHLVIENSPSPPEVTKTPLSSRTTRNKMSRENSSPDLSSRPHSIHGERPHSELYSTPKTLSIPPPNYMRLQTAEPCRSNSSFSNPPSRSESFTGSNYSGSRAGSSSPRVTSSIQRPLNFNRGTPEVENEWQKNRWRQWDNMASEKPVEGYEQETLV